VTPGSSLHVKLAAREGDSTNTGHAAQSNLAMGSLLQFAFSALVALTVYTVYRRWARISVADIPGPEPESFLLGMCAHILALNPRI
jgi:hypothetical protein